MIRSLDEIELNKNLYMIYYQESKDIYFHIFIPRIINFNENSIYFTNWFLGIKYRWAELKFFKKSYKDCYGCVDFKDKFKFYNNYYEAKKEYNKLLKYHNVIDIIE
jgi:hypothetical protein